MSLAAEEEAKKLKELEDADLERAIKLSLLEQQKSQNPTPLIQTNPNIQIKVDPEPVQTKPAPQPEKKPEEVNQIPRKLNPIDKVALKQRQLEEHDKKMKNILQNKPGPIINTKANESLNKKLEEIEANKAKNLQQYREMIMKMKKEKRHQEEIEGKDSLFIGEDEKEKGKGKEQPKETAEEIEKRKRNMSLAEKLKAKLKKNQ